MSVKDNIQKLNDDTIKDLDKRSRLFYPKIYDRNSNLGSLEEYQGEKRLVFVGRLLKETGADTADEAINAVKNEFGRRQLGDMPEATTIQDKEKMAAMKEEARRRGEEAKRATERSKKEVERAIKTKSRIAIQPAPPPIIPPRPGASQPQAQPVVIPEPESIPLSTIIQFPKFEAFTPQTKERIVNLYNTAKLGKEKFTAEVASKPIPGLSPAQLKLAIDSLFTKAQEMPAILVKETLGLGSSPEERKLIEGIGGKELADILSPTPQKPTEIPKVEVDITSTVEIPFPSIILGAYAKSIENKDPERANALKLSLYGVNKENLELLRFAAKSKGYNISSENLAIAAKTFEENSDLMRLGLMPIITDPKQFRLPPEVYQLFASEQMGLSQNAVVYRQPGIFGFAKDVVTNFASNFFGKRIEGFVEGKIAQTAVGKAVKEVGKKVITEVTKKGIGLATKELVSDVAAAISGPLAPVVKALTWLAAEALSWLARKILPWIKEHLKEIGILLGGFGVLAASPVIMAGGALILGTGIIAGGAGLTAGVGGIFATLGAGFAWIGRTLLSEIAKPLIITLITLPIVIGFILLIINNSAYMVPPSVPLSGGGGGISALGSCPIPDGIVTCGSLGSGNPNCEHGSFGYWESNRTKDGRICLWGLPSSDGAFGQPNRCGESPLNNTPCYDPTSQCKNPDGTVIYGFAADIQYPNQGACDPDLVVVFPSFNGQILQWTKFDDFTGANGANGVYFATDGTNTYEMYFTHLASVVDQGKSGDPIGPLSCALSSPHVHIELRINGDFVRPDGLCSGGGTPPPADFCMEDGPYGPGYTPPDLGPIDRNLAARNNIEISQAIHNRLREFILYARSIGYDIYVYMGYRDYEEQMDLCLECQNCLATNPDPSKCRCAVAPAAQSEHRSGKAVDMYIGGNLGSVEPMLNNDKIKEKMLELNVEHPYPGDPPHFEL